MDYRKRRYGERKTERRIRRCLTTIALFQDLLCGGVVVGHRVAGIAVLVQDVGVGDLILQPPGHANMRFR